MIKIICQCCGKDIYATPSAIKRGKKYCSVECQRKMSQTGHMINCQKCGKLFYTNRDNKKYCSRECYYKGRKYLKGKENLQSKREIRICKNCNKEFEVKLSDKKIFCSKKCSQEGHKGNNSKQYINRIKRICPICKKSFYVLPKSKRITCSKECFKINCLRRVRVKSNLTKKCIICGKVYRVIPARYEESKYCSQECLNESKRRITGEGHPLYGKVDIKCKWCGKTYKIKPSQIGKNNFCSFRCHGCYSVAHQNNPSSIEKKLAGYLIDHNISFICQFKYKLGVADFFIKPNLIIEVDGDYWHNLPKVKERDKRQTLFLEGEGYTVLHLWEHEINKKPEECINRILEYV